MRKIILSLLAALAVLVAGTLPASAAYPVHYWRFWSPDICMTIGDTSLNAGKIAASWNAAAGGYVSLHSANNCSTSYPPSRRFTIDTIHDPGASPMWCVRITDINGGPLSAFVDGNQGEGSWMLYNNNPRTWINSACLYYPEYVNHLVSAAIGAMLGLSVTNSAGYNSRVMNMTLESIYNVPFPEKYSGGLLRTIYTGGCQYTLEC